VQRPAGPLRSRTREGSALILSGSTVAFDLKGGHEAGAEARRALIAGDGELPATVRADVLLLLTELVTNAVRHSGLRPDESLHVELDQWAERVQVKVVDTGTQFTRIRPGAREDQSGGWGLLLVDRIADTWGVGPTESGTCVWFEIDFKR
jgi:anti-sigma regulatory factor (Ser/Thr protein kinase)